MPGGLGRAATSESGTAPAASPGDGAAAPVDGAADAAAAGAVPVDGVRGSEFRKRLGSMSDSERRAMAQSLLDGLVGPGVRQATRND